MKISGSLFYCFLLFLIPFNSFAVEAISLKCNNTTNPLGIESADPVFSWNMSTKIHNSKQTAYRIIIADNIVDIEKNKGNIWDSQRISGEQSLNIPYAGKMKLLAGKKYYWKVKIWDNHEKTSVWSPSAIFRMGLFTKDDWSNAQWIAMDSLPQKDRIVPGFQLAGHKGKLVPLDDRFSRMPFLRKTFEIRKKISSATVFISGLGHFELSVNGKKAGDHFLDPGWTNYDKSSLYITFDVTDQIREGENVLAVRLGNGFLNIPRDSTRYRKLLTTFALPKMICKALIEYTDGSSQTVISDGDWKVTQGAVTFSSIYGGEDYDATLVQLGWDCPGFDDSSWKKPVIIPAVGKLKPQLSPSLKVNRVLPSVSITESTPGFFIYDFGQNASAIPLLKVSGKAGSKVILRPGEYLRSNNNEVNQDNSGKPFWFSYILSGDSIQIWSPSFTYYGFRYLQVEGAVPSGYPNPKNLPVIESLQSLHTSNSSSVAGTFNCSNTLFNNIYSLIDWSIRSNMASVLTDCPHREKLGWLEVAHLMSSSIAYCYDIKQMYLKIIEDMKDSQRDNGLIPSTSPEYAVFGGDFSDSPEWGSAGVILPWFIYKWYGDISVLNDSYQLMSNYTDYLTGRAENHILSHGLGDWYDLGPNHPGWSQLTSRGLTPTAVYYYDIQVMAQVSALLGKNDDAREYKELAAKVKEAFNAKFFDKEKGYYDTGSQTANAMPIYMGLCDPENEETVSKRIVEDIRSHGNSITSGDIGFSYLLRVLEKENASNVIFDMNNQTDKPGYGYQLRKGATSLTESWEAIQTASHNHCMLGHLMEWFYSGLGGIKPSGEATAFKHFTLRPEIVGDITEVNCTFESPYGLIGSKWRIIGNMFEYDVIVPANTSAEIHIPTLNNEKISVNGKHIGKKEESVSFVGTKNNRTVLSVKSGKYLIKCPFKQ
ncbi:alpha-L-rhamnosidase-like protein [Dysgonomonas alginatilytica]|uniref:alpha-L-rhamnosidase n=1 Tax=Dysgonomonas alginatilytica TaxID=1605892 RepID=A0A2V3PL97_9BACT|nr:alpha-L-rhamnosidase [Dysgonomonas alginatilytica]PXV59964.1 alpha-L-rhamnosidase-like protein [Dysgonomonas alginatilytica]